MRRLALPAALFCFAVASVSVSGARQAASPSSRTVWDGVYTADQAARGNNLFLANCAECHGANLQGASSKALVGDVFWTDWREQTVDALLTYISKNMPFSEDGSLAGTLSASTYVDIVAHILSANELPAGTQELTAGTSAGVKIIRKDGPGELPATTLARVVGCLAPRGADGSWQLMKASRPERSTATLPPATGVPPGDRAYQLKFVLTNLTKFVGHKMAVTGLLLGDGGKDGINVNTVTSVADTCQ
jgi:S-disulfanyl-L-cysteine oxidoreductase SoxD